MVGGSGEDDCTVGAEFLAAFGGVGCARGYYYEVEVLDAKGYLYVGFAGTNLGLQCTYVGGDACSWCYYIGDGGAGHRCVGAQLGCCD